MQKILEILKSYNWLFNISLYFQISKSVVSIYLKGIILESNFNFFPLIRISSLQCLLKIISENKSSNGFLFIEFDISSLIIKNNDKLVISLTREKNYDSR